MDLKEFLVKTKNLSEIRPELIRENPETLRFIRILLGLFQNEFGELYGKDRKRVSENELGIHKPNSKTVRSVLKPEILEKLRKIENPEDVFKRNLKSLDEMRLSGFGRSGLEKWRKRGIKMGLMAGEYTPLTDQEREVMEILRPIERKVRWHINITDEEKKLIPINVDLVILPNILVLLRRVKTQEKKNLEKHATQLALESLRLKKRNPKARIFCIFETSKLPNKVSVVLNECLDWWTTSIEDFAIEVGCCPPKG